MNCTVPRWDQTPNGYFFASRLTLGFLILLIWCLVAGLAQNASRPTMIPSFRIRVTHLLGFEDSPRNARGTLSLQGNTLQFEKGERSAAQIQISSVQDVFLGEQSKQVGGLPMTLGKAAAPYGGGRVVSLFAHKKYDTLTLAGC